MTSSISSLPCSLVSAWIDAASLLAAAEGSSSVFDEMVLARIDRWWLVVAVVIAVGAHLWGARARAASVAALGQSALVQRLVGSVNQSVRTLRAIFATIAIGLVVLSLMRLQYGGVARVVQSSGLDVVLAVDYSKSMLAEDVFPNRSERLEAELARFLDESGQRGDRVGLVVFAGAARGLPLTSDMRLLRMYLERADPKTENPGGTSLGKALDMSINFLVDARRGSRIEEGQLDDDAAALLQDSDQIVVLLTDGEDTVSRPLELAERAAKLGIKVFTVGIGSQSGEPVARFDPDTGERNGYQKDEDGKYVMTRLDEETLKSLAQRTRGQYIHVDAERFGLDEIRKLMASLSRAKREDRVQIHREEGYVFVIVPALLCLCFSLAMSDRKKVKVH